MLFTSAFCDQVCLSHFCYAVVTCTVVIQTTANLSGQMGGWMDIIDGWILQMGIIDVQILQMNGYYRGLLQIDTIDGWILQRATIDGCYRWMDIIEAYYSIDGWNGYYRWLLQMDGCYKGLLQMGTIDGWTL